MKFYGGKTCNPVKLPPEMSDQKVREEFEKEFARPPYEFDLTIQGDESAWPSNYKDYHVQCAWDAWQAACTSKQKEIDALRTANALAYKSSEQESLDRIAELEAQLREQHQNQLDLMERIPVNPDEVYSPNTIVIDDKCRKCAGQMRDGKAITQTTTGVPDFIGGNIVTMSHGGAGKMIDVMKCSDCGWSATK